MKRIALTLVSVVALALAGCGTGTTDTLTNGRNGTGGGAGGTAGGEDNTFDHSNDPGGAAPGTPGNPTPSAGEVRAMGSPQVTSRLHGCGKLSYASLGELLDSRGLGPSQGRPNGVKSAQQLYDEGVAALGAANYNGRVPEAPFASTSGMSKMFDIFVMASYDAVADDYDAPACPGVKILGADGKFTKDGLSCLMGKPAKDEHLAIANDAIAKNPTDGAQIAIAALLSAAHTCQ